VELKDNRPTAPPDRKHGCDVAQQRVPVVCRLDNGNIEMFTANCSASA
jgi:hypothetical protein